MASSQPLKTYPEDLGSYICLRNLRCPKYSRISCVKEVGGIRELLHAELILMVLLLKNKMYTI